ISAPNLPTTPQLTHIFSAMTKLTYSLTSNNKFIVFVNRNQKQQPQHLNSRSDIFGTLNAGQDEDFPLGEWKVEYNSVLSKAAFLEIRAGKYFKTYTQYSIAPITPRYYDEATQ